MVNTLPVQNYGCVLTASQIPYYRRRCMLQHHLVRNIGSERQCQFLNFCTLPQHHCMIIGIDAECAKREVGHYYELRQEKHEVASNRNNPYSGGFRKLIGKRVAENDKIEKTFYDLPTQFSILSFSTPLFLINFLNHKS
ncbi:hypothetical protein E5676_scaffold83G00340 [Cucumis melo var. makuwa]|uniref:Uncharacterized protein n=1 Tax=Cucumis melo var. makuwa TaxID=1194695 RepID=A0A5D3C253_CUCMM|nr:hypothetical protein E5676_scaffold83G00340 [Cucumis melo var. makuwa]